LGLNAGNQASSSFFAYFRLTGFDLSTIRLCYNGGRSFAMSSSVVHSDPEILGGVPVFVGTRVPVKTLLDYLAGGDSLEEFLDHFPSVTRQQAVAAIAETKDLLVAHAHSS
jgi:uncharacterized protein (DUF433 family)